eukprot:1155150-Pelagomonas_calceolata.AAC.14
MEPGYGGIMLSGCNSQIGVSIWAELKFNTGPFLEGFLLFKCLQKKNRRHNCVKVYEKQLGQYGRQYGGKKGNFKQTSSCYTYIKVCSSGIKEGNAKERGSIGALAGSGLCVQSKHSGLVNGTLGTVFLSFISFRAFNAKVTKAKEDETFRIAYFGS